MKIVVNSDILISAQLFQGRMSRSFVELCDTCRDMQVPIVVPKTAMLEHRRRQAEFIGSEIRAIEEAIAVFQRHGIRHDEVDPERTAQAIDLIDLIANSGARAELFEPTFEILAEAHDRACEHRPPTANKKSDEMRDIVIWLTAVEVARTSEGAILIARDALFHDRQVNDEAAAVNLLRVTSLEDAVAKLLHAEPPAERFAKLLVVEIRDELANSGLVLPAIIEAYHVSNPVFTRGDQNKLASARFELSVDRDDALTFSATIHAEFSDKRSARITLTDLAPSMTNIDDRTITIDLNRDLDIEALAASAGLSEIVTFGDES